ncbi:hypothetical protein JTE90_015713 [Oedothorax gibbosus]|uniref:Uncharacterized protein n=1 Tax=Oedothorax gibbosus TaxID=931172 RepID=A0AAV6TH05_9ARAC|nr:hypothetical protein JTE90_015713 [Oedothorax gibbosus]
MKVQAGGGRAAFRDPRSLAGGAHRRPAAFQLVEVAEFERTRWDRKMVKYARTGRGQRKLWWRSVAVLTCKSIVRSGSSGVRLIEPSSSWLPSEVSLRIAGAHEFSLIW